MIKKLAAVIVLVMTASIFVAGCTTQTTSPTATPTPTPDDIAAMESYLGSMGYTVVDHFKYNSTESESHGVYLKPTYDGNLSKGGLRMHTTSIKADSNSDAMNLFRMYVNATRDAAFSRSCVETSSGYKNATYWQYNCTILQTKYTTVILATGDNWVVSIGPYRTN
jgi:hypothetical protein